jgi:hypothetical protein
LMSCTFDNDCAATPFQGWGNPHYCVPEHPCLLSSPSPTTPLDYCSLQASLIIKLDLPTKPHSNTAML